MNGPYQSRFLNLITHHYRRWRDEMQRTVRQGATATVWTMQAVLFPFYAAAQAGRTLRQRLQPAQSQNTNKPNGLPGDRPSDTAIQNTLKSLPELESTLEFASPKLSIWQKFTAPVRSIVAASRGWMGAPQNGISATPTAPPQLRFTFAALDASSAPSSTEIRGLASQCDTRSLVLVTVQNQILDVLSAGQQAQLHQRLTQELMGQPAQPAIAPWKRVIPAQPLLPVRWLNQAILWMQQSPVALAANWFGESPPSLSSAPDETVPASAWQSLKQWMMANVPQPGAIVLSQPDYELWDSAAIHRPSPPPNAVQTTGAIAPLPIGTVPRPVPSAIDGRSSTGSTPSLNQPAIAASLASIPQTVPQPATPTPLPTTEEWDWIDIDAQTVSYVKHPLEQVLEWLDNALLWLETQVTKLGQWLQRSLANRNRC